MKKSNVFDKVKKDHNTMFILNIVSFVALFLFLELATGVIATMTFYSQIDKDITEFSENINSGAVFPDLSPGNKKYVVNPNYLSSSRLIVIIYDEASEGLEAHLCSDSILYYLNPEFQGYKVRNDFETDEEYEQHLLEVREQIDSVRGSQIFSIESDSIGTLKTSKINNLINEEYYFRNLTVEVDCDFLPNARFAKILIMTNSEEESISSIVNVSVVTMLIVFVMSLFVSYLLSIKAIKPIKKSLDKQLEFVSDASHELRTPLAIVQSKLENILTKSESTVYDVSDDIADSLKEISRLNKLSNELLLLARDDSDRFSINLEETNMKELLNNVCEPFVEILKINQKDMILSLEEVFCECDSNLISQLMIILLDNANRYTNCNDSVKVSLTSNKSDCIIEVSDTGIGIGEDAINHIFERFYREDKTRSRETGGNGLGLSIARSIVKKHKGSIEASHNHPKGAIFKIVLPINK